MDTLRTITVIILLIGVIFTLLEFFTEEVEIFSPLASIAIIVGIILFFRIEPQDWLDLTAKQYRIMAGLLVTVGIVIIGLSTFLFIKIRGLREKPVEINNLIGKEAKVLTPISPEKPGYVLFSGAKWKATPLEKEAFLADDIAIIAQIEGLLLYITSPPSAITLAPENNSSSRYCPMCGHIVSENTDFCQHCYFRIS